MSELSQPHPMNSQRLHPPQLSPFTPDRSKDEPTMTDPCAVGVIVISSSGRMLHMNGRARVLMALFGEMHELWPHLAPESLPSILSEFCSEVFARLRSHAERTARAQFEVRRVCHMVTPPLLLRGFGVSPLSHQEPRMILTLQPAPLDPLSPVPQDRGLLVPDASSDRPRERS